MIKKMLEMMKDIMNASSEYKTVQESLSNCKVRAVIELTRVGMHYGISGMDIWNNTEEFVNTIVRIHREEPEVFTALYYNLESIQKEVQSVKNKEKILV